MTIGEKKLFSTCYKISLLPWKRGLDRMKNGAAVLFAFVMA